MELDLLHIFSNKDYFERFERFVGRSSVSKETYTILTDMKEWWKDKDELYWEAFSEWFFLVRHPTLKEDASDIFRTVFLRLNSHTLTETAEDIVKAFIGRDFAERISDTALRVAEGDTKVKLEEVLEYVDAYHKEIGKAASLETMFVTEDLHEIAEALSLSGGFKWRLNELNMACGHLRKGDFLIVSARPDSGKTTFLASESTYMAEQMEEGQHVIWFNNEEDGKKVRWRTVQAALGIDTLSMHENVAKTFSDYVAKVGSKDKIKIVDNKRLHIKDVEEILKNYPAGLVIFDQLWKVFGYEKESVSEVDRQTRMFAWAREIASIYAPVITVHQADGTAEGQMWIEMNQLYGSKTGIQGEADAIITIGRSHEPGYENVRGLYVPKNKMFAEDPTLRNGKFEITLLPEIARFKGEL
jgi:KaiC/GvpD/RAD55 family RecA-like ATPase